jgi:cyclic pyranopterin phosphate synthase
MLMETNAGRFRMIDITQKDDVFREAVAVGKIRLKPETVQMIRDTKIEKGDPLAAAEIASVMAAKSTSQLIPLCHPIPITSVTTSYTLGRDSVEVEAIVKTTAKTGVEMEALVAATTYLLTVWDMVKRHEKDAMGQYPSTAIEYIRVKSKTKGS